MGIFTGIKDFFTGIRQVRDFRKARCYYFTDTALYPNLKCIVDRDGQALVPLGLDKKVYIEKSYIEKPKNKMVYVVFDKNVKTINFNKIPKLSKVKRAVETWKKDNDNAIKSINIVDYTITGAEELSSTAFKIATTSILKYMEEPSKRELLLIGGICLVVGILGGLIISIAWL